MNLTLGITVFFALLVLLSGFTTTVEDGNGTIDDGTTTSKTTTDLLHELPLSSDELVGEHVSELHSAGSFTFVERTHFSYSKSGAERWINTTT